MFFSINKLNVILAFGEQQLCLDNFFRRITPSNELS